MCFLAFHCARATDFERLANLAQMRYGQQTKQTILALESLILALKTAPESEKLKRINDFFNQNIQSDSDQNIWGESDYWATPLEALGKGRGDCEDYTIAKYIFLRSLGVSNEHLRLTYVRAQIGGPQSSVFVAHMVLSYYKTPEAEPLLLDNLVADIYPSSRRIDLSPIFSFNSEGLWAGSPNNTAERSLNNLSRWRNVLVRIQNDGIE